MLKASEDSLAEIKGCESFRIPCSHSFEDFALDETCQRGVAYQLQPYAFIEAAAASLACLHAAARVPLDCAFSAAFFQLSRADFNALSEAARAASGILPRTHASYFAI